MEIIIWRHGKAEPVSYEGKDSARDLTPEGREHIIRIAEQLKNKGITAQKLFTSPYKRAVETSKLIQEILKCEQGIEITDSLISGNMTEKLIAAIREISLNFHSFILVGHMPDLGWLIERLTGNKNGNSSLKAGALVKIELENFEEPFRGEITLALSPE